MIKIEDVDGDIAFGDMYMVVGDGDVELDLLAQFTNNCSFLVDVPDDPKEIFFFRLFIGDELLNSVAWETNHFAKEYINIEKEAERLVPTFRFRCWQKDGTTIKKLKNLIELTFYFGNA